MAVRSVALVNYSANLSMQEVHRVAAALQRQVLNEFASVWEHTGAVIGLHWSDPLPQGYSAVYLRDDLLASGPAGVHYFSESGEAYANVDVTGNRESPWSLIAGHEVLELICDPTTDERRKAPSIVAGQGDVEYLVEICDPCQNMANAYYIDGVMVSDFYAPKYFDVFGVGVGRYSMTGAIKRPLEVLPGGYLCWRDSAGQWFVGKYGGASSVNVQPITGFANIPGDSLREKIDSYTCAFQDIGAFAAVDKTHQSKIKAKWKGYLKHCEDLKTFGDRRAKLQQAHHQMLCSNCAGASIQRTQKFALKRAAQFTRH